MNALLYGCQYYFRMVFIAMSIYLDFSIGKILLFYWEQNVWGYLKNMCFPRDES